MSTHPLATVVARRAREAFTLVELLVSVLVLTMVVLMVVQLMNNASAITRTGNKHISTDTEARTVLDRVAMDFAQMLKRTDVDYYLKQRANYFGHGNGHGWGRQRTTDLGSDQIAFFTQVPGYYPQGAQSPVSLVAYRVNQDTSAGNPAYLKLERMGKGLLWNGVSNSNIPIVFLPLTIDATWPPAVNNFGSGNPNLSRDGDYETIAPGVFRFEYYYVLKDGWVTDWPWDRRDPQFENQQTITDPINIGLAQVEAIAVTIAVIDPAGRALIAPNSLLDLAADMADFKSTHGRGNPAHKIGEMEAQWKGAIESVISTGLTNTSGLPVPPEAAKAIRVYNRTFDLKTL
jgi:hypothetical protein